MCHIVPLRTHQEEGAPRDDPGRQQVTVLSLSPAHARADAPHLHAAPAARPRADHAVPGKDASSVRSRSSTAWATGFVRCASNPAARASFRSSS